MVAREKNESLCNNFLRPYFNIIMLAWLELSEFIWAVFHINVSDLLEIIICPLWFILRELIYKDRSIWERSCVIYLTDVHFFWRKKILLRM